jgi:hypothetical protein
MSDLQQSNQPQKPDDSIVQRIEGTKNLDAEILNKLLTTEFGIKIIPMLKIGEKQVGAIFIEVGPDLSKEVVNTVLDTFPKESYKLKKGNDLPIALFDFTQVTNVSGEAVGKEVREKLKGLIISGYEVIIATDNFKVNILKSFIQLVFRLRGQPTEEISADSLLKIDHELTRNQLLKNKIIPLVASAHARSTSPKKKNGADAAIFIKISPENKSNLPSIITNLYTLLQNPEINNHEG